MNVVKRRHGRPRELDGMICNAATIKRRHTISGLMQHLDYVASELLRSVRSALLAAMK